MKNLEGSVFMNIERKLFLSVRIVLLLGFTYWIVCPFWSFLKWYVLPTSILGLSVEYYRYRHNKGTYQSSSLTEHIIVGLCYPITLALKTVLYLVLILFGTVLTGNPVSGYKILQESSYK